MRIRSNVCHFVSGVTAITLLASCSGGGSLAGSNGQVVPPASADRTVQRSVTDSAIITNLTLSRLPVPNASPVERKDFSDVAQINAPGGNQTIISDSPTKLVLVYGAGGHLNALIHKDLANPQGLATDSKETLYVADLGNVLVYAKPYSSLTRTLKDPNGWAQGVAVSPTGLVGATNIVAPDRSYGSISIFAKGATSPCVADLGSPYMKNAYYGAFDAAGNMYFDGIDPVGRTFVGELSGGCKATKIKTLTTANTIGLPGGVQVSNGHLLIVDQVNKAIYAYKLPSGRSLGAPTATTHLSAIADPIAFTMLRGGDRAWVADATYFANPTEYTYPGGSVLNSAYAEWQIFGIAVNPAASP